MPRQFTGDAARRWSDPAAFAAALVAYSLFYSAYFLRSFLSGDYIAPSDSLDFGLASFLSPQDFWTQGMYSGYPIGADPQSSMWYPPFRVMRAIGGWNAFMVMPYVIASSTCFLLVRRLTASTVAAVFAGFVFGFSGVMLAHISHFNQIHAAAWLPLVVYALQLIRERHEAAGVLSGSVAFALTLLAGHPQNAVYGAYLCMAIVGGWIVIDECDRRTIMRRVAVAGVMAGLGIVIAAVTVVPMLELAAFSRRAESNWALYASKQLPPWQLLTMVLPLGFGGFRFSTAAEVPYLGEHSPLEMTGYAGLLPISLTLCGPLLVSRSRREASVWLFFTVFAALLALGAATPIGAAFFYAPGYSRFRVPARHLFVVALTCSVAAGVVLAEVTAHYNRWRSVSGAVATTVMLGLAAGSILVWSRGAFPDLGANTALYITWAIGFPIAVAAGLVLVPFLLAGRARTRHSPLWVAAPLIVLHLADMLVFHFVMPGYNFEYAEVEAWKIQPHPRIRELADEVAATGERLLAVNGSQSAFLLPNLPRAWRVNAASGTGSLAIAEYQEIMQMGGPGDVNPDVLAASHVGLDLFRVRYILVPAAGGWADVELSADRWIPTGELRRGENETDTLYRIYRNARSLPSAWCATSLIPANDAEALAAIRSGRLADGRPLDSRESVLVPPERLPQPQPAASITASASVIVTDASRSPEYTVYRIKSAPPGMVVVSDVYYAWWRARIDGNAVTPVRVNHALVGVPAPAGEHVLELQLRPVSVWIGLGLTSAGLLSWIALAIAVTRKRNRTTVD